MGQALIQAGTDSYENNSHDVWIEWLNANGSGVSEQPTGADVPSGDVVYDRVLWTGNAANFYIEDQTTGTVYVNTQIPLASEYYGDGSAEWINERPTHYSPLVGDGKTPYVLPMTNYDVTYWSAGSYDLRNDNAALPLGKMDSWSVEATQDGDYQTPGTCSSTDMISFPYNLNLNGGTSFISYWCHAGDTRTY